MLLKSKNYAAAQKVPEDFGYRHIKLKYLDDPVDVIVISKQGEERIAKPLFFFCQGSLPQPVVKYDENGLYETLPFDEELFLKHFHIVIIGKPFIPIICNASKLGKDFMFLKDHEKQIPPKEYTDRNYLDYYVFRNNSILKQLFKYRWVKTSQLLVGGHCEGSSIAVKMAVLNKKITHLIYSAGNPYGKMASILEQSRSTKTDALSRSENVIDRWKNIVKSSTEIQYTGAESSKAIYSFSLPQRDNLLQLKIPVLMCYGTKDWGVSFNDLFQIEAIRERKSNIVFKSYTGLLHTYCLQNADGFTEIESCNWDSAALDWLGWWQQNKNCSAETKVST